MFFLRVPVHHGARPHLCRCVAPSRVGLWNRGRNIRGHVGPARKQSRSSSIARGSTQWNDLPGQNSPVLHVIVRTAIAIDDRDLVSRRHPVRALIISILLAIPGKPLIPRGGWNAPATGQPRLILRPPPASITLAIVSSGMAGAVSDLRGVPAASQRYINRVCHIEVSKYEYDRIEGALVDVGDVVQPFVVSVALLPSWISQHFREPTVNVGCA